MDGSFFLGGVIGVSVGRKVIRRSGEIGAFFGIDLDGGSRNDGSCALKVCQKKFEYE